jgi:hypothetical protein
MTSIMDARPLVGCDTTVMIVEAFLTNSSEEKTKGSVRIGRVNFNFGWDEALALMHLSKSVSSAKS